MSLFEEAPPVANTQVPGTGNRHTLSVMCDTVVTEGVEPPRGWGHGGWSYWWGGATEGVELTDGVSEPFSIESPRQELTFHQSSDLHLRTQ